MRTVLAVLFVLFASPALAQVEVPMTPTPTPTPEVAPIPTYPERRAAPEVATGTATSPSVRVDSSGMFGAGFMVGNTATGATAKIWFTPDFAMQFGAGAGPLGNNVRFQLDLLYSFHRFDGEDGEGKVLYSLPFYVGVGAQAGIYFKHPWPDDRTDLGVRVPIGMSVVIPDNPVEIFFEVAPDGAVYDDANDSERFVFYVDGAIGLRYYF